MKLTEILLLTSGKFDTGKHDDSLCQLLSNHGLMLNCRGMDCHLCPLNHSSLVKEMAIEAD